MATKYETPTLTRFYRPEEIPSAEARLLANFEILERRIVALEEENAALRSQLSGLAVRDDDGDLLWYTSEDVSLKDRLTGAESDIARLERLVYRLERKINNL